MLIFVRFNLNFTVVSNEWSLGKCKDILSVWNSLFMTAVIPLILIFPKALPSVWILIQVCFVANKEGKIINSKNYTTLEQDYDFRKVSYVQKIYFQVWMLCQGPHLAKYASKGIYKIREMVTILFCLSLATMISFCHIVPCHILHLWTSTCHIIEQLNYKLVCVCIKM